MALEPTALERAFALARSGKYSGVSEIRAQLRAEGFSETQLVGRMLVKQIREICAKARRAL